MTTPTPSPSAPEMADGLDDWFDKPPPPAKPKEARESEPADLRVLLGAVIAGIGIDLALRRPPSLATGVAILLTALVLLWSNRLTTRTSQLLVAAAPLFGIWPMFRSSDWLIPLDLVAAFGLLGLGAALGQGGAFSAQGLRTFQRHLYVFFFDRVWQALPFAWRGVKARGISIHGKQLGPVLTGLILATPVVVTLGALLVSADAVFASIFVGSDVAASVPGHVFLVAIGTFVVLALMYSASVRQEHTLAEYKVIGATEASVILGCVAALFACFAGAQVAGAVAGSDAFVSDLGATSEWARNGFFQLLAVSAITLALLVTLQNVTDRPERSQQLMFNRLSMVTVVFTLVIVAVSIQRTAFYVNYFGMTMLRLYSTLFALWIGLVFVAFGLRLLGVQKNRQWVPAWAMSSGLVLLLALNVVNVEAMATRYNVDNAWEYGFDASYAVYDLSDDAIPTLIGSLDELDKDARDRVAGKLCTERPIPAYTSGLSYNRSSNAARKALLGLCR